MSDGLIVKASQKGMWDRSLAIHEAGHAVAAWLHGARHIEISLADEFRVARLGNGKIADDCRAVCSFNPQWQGVDFLAGMIVSFSGVMAQHLHTGEEPTELLKKGGRGDAKDIMDALDKYRSEGATEEECRALYDQAYSFSLKLVTRYWWEIIAVAKMTEHYNYVSPARIRSLLSMFVSTLQPLGILEELEA